MGFLHRPGRQQADQQHAAAKQECIGVGDLGIDLDAVNDGPVPVMVQNPSHGRLHEGRSQEGAGIGDAGCDAGGIRRVDFLDAGHRKG